MIPTTPSGEGCTSAFNPTSRAPSISLVARIHWATWDLVCSITEIMPSTSVNNEPVLGLLPKSVSIASMNSSALSSTSASSRSMRLRRTATSGGPSTV